MRGPLTNYHVDFALPLIINFMENVFINMRMTGQASASLDNSKIKT